MHGTQLQSFLKPPTDLEGDASNVLVDMKGKNPAPRPGYDDTDVSKCGETLARHTWAQATIDAGADPNPADCLAEPPAHFSEGTNADRYLALLESISTPTAVCREDGAIVTINARMQELLAAADGLYVRNGLLRCSVASERDELLAVMQRAKSGGARQNLVRCSIVPVTRTSGKARLPLIVSPLGTGEYLLRVVLPEHRNVLDADALVQLFHLTPSEATLVIALVRTGNLMDAAKACGLTVGSARQYLKRVFIKTSTSGQVALVSLVLQLPTL